MKRDIVADTILREIENRGLKQKYVAEKAGFTQSQFNAMVKGRKLILAEYIPRIANALNITPNQIYGIEEHNGDARKVS